MALTTVRFRPLFGRIITVVIVALAVLGIAGFAAAGDWLSLSRNFGTIAFIAVMVWAVFWRPELVVADDGVTVANVFATHHIAWQAIERIDTRYSLSIHTKSGKVAVWASPSPGRRGGSQQLGETASTAPGQITQVLYQHWESMHKRGQVAAETVGAPSTQSRRWHRKTIVALVALLLIGIVLPFI